MIKNGFGDLINDSLKATWQQEYEKYKVWAFHLF